MICYYQQELNKQYLDRSFKLSWLMVWFVIGDAPVIPIDFTSFQTKLTYGMICYAVRWLTIVYGSVCFKLSWLMVWFVIILDFIA